MSETETETETKILARALPTEAPSGGMSHPQIREVKLPGGVVRKEAHYFDPITGALFQRITISETRPKKA